MSSETSPAVLPRIESWRWRIVWLLFLATLINYMDRLALNNTQRYLLPEFVPMRVADEPFLAVGGGIAAASETLAISHARNQTYAGINFAFGVSFAIFQIVAGFLIDRFSLRWLYLGAIVIWSAAGVITGFVPAGAVAALMACRIILGVGEAFNWPCAVACIRRVIPRESRGLANGIFHSGASIGAVATPLLVLAIVDTKTGEGWRTVFIVVGSVGVSWAVLWLMNTTGERGRIIDAPPESDIGQADSSGPFIAVFGMKLFWICLITGVCVNLTWHFYNQWFPRFLTEDLRLTGRGEQWVLAGFFIAADLGSLTAGWTTRKLARAGVTVESSRKYVMLGISCIVFTATLPAAWLPYEMLELKLALFFVVAAAAMGGFTVFFSLAQDIVPRHTAQILGVCGCMSWLVISGVAVQVGGYAEPGKYAELFILIGCVPLIAAAVGRLWPEPVSGGSENRR